MHDPVREVQRKAWRDGRLGCGARQIPEETALALTYNGGTYAVMMGTPRDLRDFAIGFSLSEGVVQSADEIASLDIVELDDGIELRMWLAPDKAEPISARCARMAGVNQCSRSGRSLSTTAASAPHSTSRQLTGVIRSAAKLTSLEWLGAAGQAARKSAKDICALLGDAKLAESASERRKFFKHDDMPTPAVTP